MSFFIPNLFLPGVAKCGTTTLHELLNQHPNISMSTRKEPHFWTDLNFDNFTQEQLDNYKSYFIEKDNYVYYGESSTGSLFFPEMFIRRLKVHKTNHIKFIIILRNPIDRCYSHYWWCKGSGREKKTFMEAVEYDLTQKFTYYYDWPKYYFQFGLYSKWLEPFIKAFDLSNIKIITLERLKDNPLDTLNECYNFLNLTSVSEINTTKSNETVILRFPKLYNLSRKISKGNFKFTKGAKYFLSEKSITKIRFLMNEKLFKILGTNKKYPIMKQAERRKLKELYTQEIKQLEILLNRNFCEWHDFYDK